MDTQANPRMDWEARDLPNAFKKFKEHCDFMFGGPLEKKTEEAKCNYLMLWVGEKGRQIFSTWTLTADERKQLQTYYTHFEQYCAPKVNHIYSRYKFKSCTQAEGQTFEEFVTELKLLIKDCGYADDIQNEMIRDHIVFGVRSHKIREKLINEGSSLTLERCIDLSRTYELSQTQLMDINGQTQSVSAIKKSPGPKMQKQQPQQRSRYQHRESTNHPGHGRPSTTQQRNFKGSAMKCNNCGSSHSKYDLCPAKGQQCLYCKKFNHFAKVCRRKQMDLNSRKINEVTNFSTIDHDQSQSADDYLYVSTVEHDSLTNQAFAKVKIHSTPLSMKIDTGAQVNVLPRSIFRSLGKSCPLQPSQKKLTVYNGQHLKVDGYLTLPCEYNGQISNEEFYIVDTNSSPILGLQTCLKLNLIKLVLSNTCSLNTSLTKEQILGKYSDVFTGIGKLPGEFEIHLHDKVTPVVHPPRRVPVAIRDKLKAELDRMENLGIITKVTEPTDWVNSLVVVEKPNFKVMLRSKGSK